jgi:uncharacterized protein
VAGGSPGRMQAVAGRRCVLLFTKPSRPGRVKTRLIGELSARQAASLHEAFLLDLVERLQGGAFTLRLAWALEPDEEPPPSPLPGLRQVGADLGERLFRGLAEALHGNRWVAAVGSDRPELTTAEVERAFSALEGGAGVVLGPASDGGYYLIALGLPALDPGLFREIPWSTGAVLEATLERCRSLGVEPYLLPRADDVDTPADLERLAGRLAAAPGSCPRTRALLASWNRLPAPVEA